MNFSKISVGGFLALSLSLSLVACKVKRSSGGSEPGAIPQPKAEGFMDPRPTIAGPNLVGQWVSKCNPLENGKYRVFAITFTDSTTVRKATTYDDKECTKVSSEIDKDGPYRFIEKYDNGGYEVEYVFKLDGVDGQYAPKEHLKLDGEKLLIANLNYGSLSELLTNEPLLKAGGGTPGEPVKPVDPNAPSESAVNYTEAKYAYCVLQERYIVILDFNGADLSRKADGTAKMGIKLCDQSTNPADIKWGKGDRPYRITFDGGAIKILFADNNDRIEADSNSLGLIRDGWVRGAFSVLAGNSGKCAFTKNASLVQPPFICGE